MILNSAPLLAAIGVGIAAVAVAAVIFLFRFYAAIKHRDIQVAVLLLIAGMTVISFIHITDLYTLVTVPADAAGSLHRQWDWPVMLAGFTCIGFGLVLLVSRLLPRIARSLGPLETAIAEREKAVAELADSEARMRAIFDNAPVTISLKDTDSRYRMVNRRFRDLFDKAGVDVIGRKPDDIFDRDLAEQTATHDRDVATGGKAIEREERIVRDGEVRHLLTVKFPIVDEAGNMTGLGSIATDITGRKLLEEELRRRERLSTLGQLTGTVAHELRNPLGTILSSINLIKSKITAPDDFQERAFQRVDRNIMRCDNIITELLDYARATGLQPQETDLDSWLASVVGEQQIPAGITVKYDLQNQDAVACIDPDRLRRAVINVVDNACQAMTGPEGESTGELTVATRRIGERFEIAFGDTGTGIPADILPQVLEPLFSTRSFGTGLGLPTVQRILEEHNGGMEISSEAEQGTRVLLWLPPCTGDPGDLAP